MELKSGNIATAPAPISQLLIEPYGIEIRLLLEGKKEEANF